jgi:hypothetical protein
MDSRSPARLLMAAALAVYGVYIASYALAMIGGPAAPLLLLGFVLQTASALGGAFAVWTRARWAARAVLLLGLSVAGTWLVEAFVLGIVAYLTALLVAVIAIGVALVLGAYLDRARKL